MNIQDGLTESEEEGFVSRSGKNGHILLPGQACCAAICNAISLEHIQCLGVSA